MPLKTLGAPCDTKAPTTNEASFVWFTECGGE